MELVLSEHPQEDVLGEDVLQQHLADVGGGHGGAYALLAQLQEGHCGLLILRVVDLGLLYGLPQVADDGWQVGLELLLRLAELLYFRQLVVQERANEPVELSGAGHLNPHHLLPVLNQDGGLGVSKMMLSRG